MATLEGANADFRAKLEKLMASTGAKLTSGYRSDAEQEVLYNAAVKRYGKAEAGKWAAPPGRSNHGKGFAADISNYDKISDEQLAQFGLYRPMSWEPWHVEPIGYRSEPGAYTTPQVQTPGLQAVQTFDEAMQMLMSQVGEQPSNVGETVATVGEDLSSVGQAQIAQPQATRTATATMPTGGSASESAYADLFNAAGAKYGIDPRILQEVARAESGFDPSAGSPAGAQGLMQFMPSTAKGMGVNPMDPASAVDGAARLLVAHMKKFGSLELALAAYNAGGGAVEKYGGIPPFKETQNYVKKITARLG